MSNALTLSTGRIPPADLHEFLSLPAEVRQAVERWIAELSRVVKPIQTSLLGVAARMQVSIQTARRRYDDWRHTGDWRVLVDRRKCPASSGLAPEFLDYWQALVERNQRASRPAWRVFERSWRRGDLIPGLDPSLPRHTVPRGCTYANLMRLAPTKFELVSMRLGRGAAATYRPKVLGTRVGLWVGSHYMFDDMWHDNFVVFRGAPVRVLEFDAFDVFSACKFAWGAAPRIRRDDGSMEGLKGHQMTLLLAASLYQTGYSPRGTELLAELGTAAISEAEERLLYDRSGGLIRTRRAGITGREQSVAGMFRGSGGGNSRFKGAIESLRNLIHNELGALPGQTGMDRDHRPEQLAGELAYTDDLLKAKQVLPARLAAMLRLPLLDYHSQFLPVLSGCYDLINGRTWHALEGWSECGHVVVDYRVSASIDAWLSPGEFLSLPPAEQSAVAALARADARTYTRTRQLSPTEVFRSGRGELIRLPAGVVCELLGPDLVREERVDSGAFRFQDSELSPEALTYEARVRHEETGSETELRHGETYRVFVNPFDLEQLFVTDARGRFLGVARRDRRVIRTDAGSVQRAWGRVAHRDAELLAPIRRRHAQWSRDQVKLREHNARVISAEGVAEAADAEAADAALEDAFA